MSRTWGWPLRGTWVRACGLCGLPAPEPHDHRPLPLSPLEKAAWEDYDLAAAAWSADPSEENRQAYLAATRAAEAAVTRAMELRGRP